MNASRFLDRMPTVGGIVTLILAVATVVVAGQNRELQETANAGQKRIANAQAVGNLDNMLIRLLATAAVEHNDADIKALLAANGITYRQGPPAPGSPAAATTEAGQ